MRCGPSLWLCRLLKGPWLFDIGKGRGLFDLTHGPFVMNTKDELVKAYEDFQSGRMGQIPAEKIPHRGAADEDPIN